MATVFRRDEIDRVNENATNIIQQQIVPNKPKILTQERIYVYVPKATSTTPGIAAFRGRDFNVIDSMVSLVWPMEMEIEELSDPLANISRIKLLEDEFEHTGNSASLTNPDNEVVYNSNTAEIKLNRKNRNAFVRPDLIMLDNVSDFTSTTENNYTKYTLKHNNPLEQASLIKIDTQDFNRNPNTIVDIRWPYAHNLEGTNRTNGYGLIKLNPTGHLKFNDSGLLDADLIYLELGISGANETANEAKTIALGIEAKAITAINTSNNAVSIANEAITIALNANHSKVFLTEEDMFSWISDPNNKHLFVTGDTFWIIDSSVPDYWIIATYDDPNEDGYYYEVTELESKLPDISNMMTTDTTQIITGDKNFTGELQKDGVNVATLDEIEELKHYDIIISTQAEFNTLLSSPNWLNAKSVAIIGLPNFGYYEYGDSTKGGIQSTSGICIPENVTTIVGFNNVKIIVRNFLDSYGGLIWTDDDVVDRYEFSIKNIYLINDNTVPDRVIYGFYQLSNITNCQVYVYTSSTTYKDAAAFYGCTNIKDCIGEIYTVGTTPTRGNGFALCRKLTNCIGAGRKYGFYICEDLINCRGQNKSASLEGSAFYNCSYLTNCKVYDYSRNYGFEICKYLTNCDGSFRGSFGAENEIAYGFYMCSYLTNCKGLVNTNLTSYTYYQCNNLLNCEGYNVADENAYAFYECTYLTNCQGLGLGDTIGYAFYQCSYGLNCIALESTTDEIYNCTKWLYDYELMDADGIIPIERLPLSYLQLKEEGKELSTNDLTDTLKDNYDTAYSHSQIVDGSNPHATTFANLESKPTTISGYGITDALNSSLKGSVNGLAELDATGKVPSTQLPSYVDDVIEVANYASLPVTGEDGKIYITLDTNLTYRWGGSVYVEISPSLALGETSSTAYRGDMGKTAYDHSQLTSGNPHNVTKSNVGLGNVYNPTAYGGISYGGGAGESGVSFTDLNSLVYTGFYTCYGTTANVPSASYSWFVQHINSNVGNVSATQTAIAYGTTNIIYKRNKSSSTWSAWENISPSLKENLTNKVTSISSSSTDTQYPSAKCVYDIIGNIETLLAEV